MLLLLVVCVCVCVCVFQRALRSAGGSVVPVPVVSRRTGAELSRAASSAPAACRATVWTHNTTATVTPTAWSGTEPLRIELCRAVHLHYVSISDQTQRNPLVCVTFG